MAFREIVTKAVIGKGKKRFVDRLSLKTADEQQPTTVLGCWIINHTFSGTKIGNRVQIQGSYDINVWYSYDNDTKTEVLKETYPYQENITITGNAGNRMDEEIIVRSLSGPSCVKAEIVTDGIECRVEKTLGIELVGDTKVRINVDEETDDNWDEIMDSEDTIDQAIDQEVTEDYLKESIEEEAKEE